MKKSILITFVLVLFIALNASAQSIQDQISALEQEDNNIQQDYGTLNNDIQKYNIVEKNLEAEAGANDAKKNNLTRVLENQHAEGVNLDQAVASYNASCGDRTFSLPAEQAAYDNCIANKSALEARTASFNRQLAENDRAVAAFNAESEEMNTRIFKQKADLDNLNKRDDALKARNVELNRKYDVLRNGPAFQQLLRGDKISKECVEAIKNNRFNDARHCLDVFWDGAN